MTDMIYNHAPTAVYSMKISAMAKLVYERMYSLSKDASQVIFFKQKEFSELFAVTEKTLRSAIQELLKNCLIEIDTSIKKSRFDNTKYYQVKEPKIEQKTTKTVGAVQPVNSTVSNRKYLPVRLGDCYRFRTGNCYRLQGEKVTGLEQVTVTGSSLDRNKKEYISKNIERKAGSLPFSFDDIFVLFTQKANELKKDHLAIERMHLPTIAEKFFNFWLKKNFKFNLGLDGNITKWLLDECEHIESNLLRDTTSEEELKRKEQEENAERYTQRLMNERGWTREQVLQYDKDCTVNLPPLDPNEPLKRALGLI